LVAGLVIAETEYRNEVELVTEPFKGLALGVFLITVGMRIDVGALLTDWPSTGRFPPRLPAARLSCRVACLSRLL
jgi:Kef-type K+ transport system membrane component KefB